MKNVFYEEFKGLKDYSPCMRYVDGTLVDPVAYRRWLIKDKVKHYVKSIRDFKNYYWRY